MAAGGDQEPLREAGMRLASARPDLGPTRPSLNPSLSPARPRNSKQVDSEGKDAVMRRFAELDWDHDQKISFDEFLVRPNLSLFVLTPPWGRKYDFSRVQRACASFKRERLPGYFSTALAVYLREVGRPGRRRAEAS